ncbi:MAG: MAPEG family protein [Xanthomonadales bacterium]|nr:MAPEG family protein [Xanthomonadales bacterium]
MEYPTLIVLLALLQYIWFSIRVGIAREKYHIEAPACAGEEVFERLFRVQQNTLEQLIVFVPVCFAFAHFLSPLWALILGAVFIVGRFLYASEYVKNPKSRSLGFALTFLPNAALLIGALIGVFMGLV